MYSVLGDSAFSIGPECYRSYCRIFAQGAQLLEEEKKVSNALKAARIAMEKNHAMIGNIFCIFESPEAFKS